MERTLLGEDPKQDKELIRLWDLYSPLLTDSRKEISDLYFNCDLSLAEIAEEKGVSRQSVSDCLKKTRKKLEEYERKLGFLKIVEEWETLKAEKERKGDK